MVIFRQIDLMDSCSQCVPSCHTMARSNLVDCCASECVCNYAIAIFEWVFTVQAAKVVCNVCQAARTRAGETDGGASPSGSSAGSSALVLHCF